MRNSPWFRMLATMLALWFPLIAGEPGLLHPCPMHGAGAAVAASLTGHSAAHAAHAAHGAGHHAAPDQGSAPSHQHQNCTCINGCSVSLSAASAPTTTTIDVVVLEHESVSAVSTAPTLARPSPDFARPFNTGPPRA